MYYEEKIINDQLMWRNSPTGKWAQCSISSMSQRIVGMQDEITRLRAQLAEAVTPETLEWIKTSEGRIGVGYSNRTESGGFTVIKWMPDDFLAETEGQINYRKDLEFLIAAIDSIGCDSRIRGVYRHCKAGLTHPAPAKVPAANSIIEVDRRSDFTVAVILRSCRAATVFERWLKSQGGE